MYTARIIREKAASILEIEEEELRTPEMKSLLDVTIEEHFSALHEESSSATDEEENKDMSSNEIEDELDSEGNPVDGIAAVKEAAPSPKKRKADTAPKTVKKVKAAAKPTKKSQKQQDQLTKLKSYVFKCGVRKVWKKELEGLDEKASIDKVIAILNELGMEGRPTLEKCKKIKEQREYAEEMKIIDESKILTSRLRRGKATDEPVAPPPKITPRIDLSAFGDPDSE